jgi:tRNA nucleotidyltransferase (CCA-adding enzyme)
VGDLAIDGHVLMKELKIKAGPILGIILKQLLELVLEKPEMNTKTKLLVEAGKVLEAEKK